MSTEERLAQVERQLRWLKRLGALAIAAGAVVVLGGQAEQKDDERKKEPPFLQAQQLMILDRDHKARASLGIAMDGSAALMLCDRDKPESAGVVLQLQRGFPSLWFFDKDARLGASVSLQQDGAVVLKLLEKPGNTRAALRFESDGRPRLTMSDSKGKVIWKAPGE